MTRPSRRLRSNAGFTLIEALISIAVMAIILGALATITAQWLPNWSRGFAGVQRSEMLALGLERLVDDLASAEIIPASGENGPPIFEGAELSVVFVRTALGPNAVGLELVQIAERSNERGAVLVRTKAPFFPADRDSPERLTPNFANPVVLVRAPYRVSFAYVGADGVWKDVWLNERRLPRAIRVVMRNAATGQTLATSTAVGIRAELPAACARTRSVAECLNPAASPASPAAVNRPVPALAGRPQ